MLTFLFGLDVNVAVTVGTPCLGENAKVSISVRSDRHHTHLIAINIAMSNDSQI